LVPIGKRYAVNFLDVTNEFSQVSVSVLMPVAFKLHRMHEMLTIVTDVCGECHVLCVRGHSVQPSPYAFRLLLIFAQEIM